MSRTNNFANQSFVSDISALSSEGTHANVGQTNTRCDDENVPMNNRIGLGRLSMSDANLNTPEQHRSNLGGKSQSYLNIKASPGSGLVPISATLRENKELKSDLEMCRAQLQVANYREREARSMLSREVNDIIEEFFKMQLAAVETDEKLREYDSLQTILNQVTCQRDEAVRDLFELQQVAQKNMEQYESQFEHLNRQLESARTQTSNGYEDFTLASSIADPDVVELQAKLNEALEENAKLSDSNTELQKQVATLATSLEEKYSTNVKPESDADKDNLADNLKVENDKMIEVIQKLIESESALKKRLHKYQTQETVNETPQLVFSDKAELLEMVSKLETELKGLRSDNWDMRKQCAQLKGLNLEDSLDDMEYLENKVDNIAEETSRTSQIDEYLNQLRKMNGQMKTEYGIDFNVTNFKSEVKEHNKSAASVRQNQSSSFNADAVSSLANCSQLNANESLADILQVSMNTAQDVRQVKLKLETLKELLVSMFERLRGSAAIFEEVYKYLSNGSAENKEIAEKIRLMKLEFISYSAEDSRVEKAVAEAEKSMTQLQANLSVLEQSLNQSTSFILDASRRTSIGANQSKTENRQVSYTADKTVILELQEKIALDEAHMVELKSFVTETKTRLVDVTEARDKALSSVDSLRKRLEALNEENAAVTQEKHEQYIMLQSSQNRVIELNLQVEKVNENNKQLAQQREDTENKWARSVKDTEEAQQQNVNLEHELEEIKQAVCKQCRTKTSRITSRAISWIRTKFRRSEITQRLILTTEELEKTKSDLVDRKTAFEELRVAKEDCLKKLSQIELDNQHLRNKFAELEAAARRKEGAIAAERDRVIEESAAARDTMQMLGKRVEELETELDRFESRNGHSFKREANEVLDMSCLARANNMNKLTQTTITAETLNKMYSETEQLQNDMDRLHVVYSTLATAIYTHVSPCSIPDELYNKDIGDMESSTQELVDLLQEASEKNNSALEQLDYIIASQEVQRNVSNNSTDANAVVYKYKHQITPIDEHKYSSKMRQDFYALTTLAMDLTANIKSAEKVLRPQNKVDLVKITEASRKLRTELHDHLTMISKPDKENVIPQTINELVYMNQKLNDQNDNLYKSLKENRTQLQLIKNKVANSNSCPDLLKMIQEELTNIEHVMSGVVESVPVLGRR